MCARLHPDTHIGTLEARLAHARPRHSAHVRSADGGTSCTRVHGEVNPKAAAAIAARGAAIAILRCPELPQCAWCASARDHDALRALVRRSRTAPWRQCSPPHLRRWLRQQLVSGARRWGHTKNKSAGARRVRCAEVDTSWNLVPHVTFDVCILQVSLISSRLIDG